MKTTSSTLNNSLKRYVDIAFLQVAPSENLEDIFFSNCTFTQCDFSNSKFIRCKLSDCEFVRCNLNMVSINGTSFSQVHFTDSKLTGINWTVAKWPQIKLTSPISFFQCNISHSSFFGLSLIEVIMDSCKAHEVDFRECDLSNAYLVATDFHKSLFMHTKLNRANFTNAINYTIDIHFNEIKKAKFTFPDVVALLKYLDIEISGMDNL